MTTLSKEKKPLLALTSSLIMPGLGQIYNGNITQGFSLFLGFAFSSPICAWLGIYGPQKFLWILVLLGVVISLGIYIFSIWEAYRSAKKPGRNFQLPFYAYISIVLFSYFFILNQLSTYTKTELLEAYKIPSMSMTPNILRGDQIFVDKQVNYPGAKAMLHRGDAAVFVFPNDRTKVFVKRVIGLPGDLIEIQGTDIQVNGKLIRKTAPQETGDYFKFLEEGDHGQYEVLWKKSVKRSSVSLQVPNGQAFVLGDNRDESLDSREFGTVPLMDIIGRVKQVWFSNDPDTGIRWSRLGKILDINE